jgi:hypothetical protein
LSYAYDARPVGARDWDAERRQFRPSTGGLLGRLSGGTNYQSWEEFWQGIEERAVVHAHWHAHPELIDLLRRDHLPVVTMARHPLDVLISHLAWVNRNLHEDLGLNELKGATPISSAFSDFATGELAQWLLSITPGWWLREDVLRVRYEKMVEDPAATLTELTNRLGPPRQSVEETLAASERESLKKEPSPLVRLLPGTIRSRVVGAWSALSGSRRSFVEQHRERKHYWQGRPGLWRELVPQEIAEPVAAAHTQSFESLGYACDPDPTLTAEQAEQNWSRYIDS